MMILLIKPKHLLNLRYRLRPSGRIGDTDWMLVYQVRLDDHNYQYWFLISRINEHGDKYVSLDYYISKELDIRSIAETFINSGLIAWNL